MLNGPPDLGLVAGEEGCDLILTGLGVGNPGDRGDQNLRPEVNNNRLEENIGWVSMYIEKFDIPAFSGSEPELIPLALSSFSTENIQYTCLFRAMVATTTVTISYQQYGVANFSTFWQYWRIFTDDSYPISLLINNHIYHH